MFIPKQTAVEVGAGGFIFTVLSKYDAQYLYHLTILMQDYLGTGANDYQMRDTLIIFNNNPHMADTILYELQTLINTPRPIPHKANSSRDLIDLLRILELHYRKYREITLPIEEKLISVRIMLEKFIQQDVSIITKQDHSTVSRDGKHLSSSNPNSEGFIRTVLSRYNAEYHSNLVLLMQNHLRIAPSRYQPSLAVDIFDNNPAMADSILWEMRTLMANPRLITDKNNWQESFAVHTLPELNVHYQRIHDIEAAICVQDIIAVLLAELPDPHSTVSKRSSYNCRIS